MSDGSTDQLGDEAEMAPAGDADAMEADATPGALGVETHDATASQSQAPQPRQQPTRPAETADDEGPAELQQIRSLRARVAELERTLADERDHAGDYMRRWQTAQADFSNFKRRATQEQAQHDALLAAQALAPAIVALDSLERAFLALPPSLRSLSWIEGIALVELQLRRALELQGIRQLSVAPGQAFDPLRHEVIGEVASTEHPVGHVVVVVQQGYEAQGRLLRPALVQVARSATPAQTAEPTTNAPVANQPTEPTSNQASAPVDGAGEAERSRANDDAQPS